MIIQLVFIMMSFLRIQGKILRVGHHFTAHFVIVDSNSRVTSNCIRNITTNCPLKRCVKECIATKQCKTFNYHKVEGICELLTISKFDSVIILRREKNWVHYETDEDANKVIMFGYICT